MGTIVTSINKCSDSSVESHLPENTSSTIKLVEPDLDNSATLMQALSNRKTVRSFSDEPVGEQDLSNLLWAAAGINRNDGGKTVPLLGDIAIFVAMESGVYLYNPKKHELEQKLADDIRGELSPQDIVEAAPVALILTINDASFPSFLKKAMEEAYGMDFYYGNQVAYSTQNVSLYAASNNMNSVIIGGIHRDKIDKMLNLDRNHHSYLVQLVGY